MKVKRIMSNTATSDLKQAAAFYGDILGLELLMDHGWFQTYGSDEKMTVQNHPNTYEAPGCQGAAADALKRAAELGRSASSGQPRVFKER
jgi:catechol 2,3-dioxygenase-like lactoylglutathione lyase family enzyme